MKSKKAPKGYFFLRSATNASGKPCLEQEQSPEQSGFKVARLSFAATQDLDRLLSPRLFIKDGGQNSAYRLASIIAFCNLRFLRIRHGFSKGARGHNE